jgi:aspartate/methionine/tyrosine aminotransferase
VLQAYLDRVGPSYARPEGAYFVMIDISPLGWRNDMEVFHWMTREIGVAFDPCSSFFATEENRYIRLNFAKKLTRSIGLANDCFVSIGGWTIRCGREIDIGWRWAEVDAQISRV